MPCSSANATVLTSAAPNSDPSAAQTSPSTMTVPHGIRGRGPVEVCRGCAGGSVERCAAKARVPTTAATRAAISPASGCQDVARIVTRIGPSMNTVSSQTASSANAVCSWSADESTCDQRARTHEPTAGRVAPATAAAAYVVISGQSAWTDHMSKVREVAKTATTGTSTRAWPSRSSSRPWNTARPPFAIMYAAETDPARAYDPVAADTSSTIPRLTMEIGSRATNPVALNRRVPGLLRIRRYDDSIEVSVGPGGDSQPILVAQYDESMVPDVTPYDALLLVSFGGPEAPEDVLPFLENVTRGRGIPRERLEEVGKHYHLFGGRSPINDQNRDAAGGAARGPGRCRDRAPGLLGQPQLGPVPDRDRPPDGRRTA